MLSNRSGTVLNSIVGHYIVKAVPISSQSIINEYELKLSSATIRSEMVHLEQAGYIIRPHTSAGSVPLDKGYRFYVESLTDIQLPIAEQIYINHLFHQVERELEEWLNLAASIASKMVQDVVIITMPKPVACRFKHLEIVALHESLALLVLVLHGARARQQLISFDKAVEQSELTFISNKLNTACLDRSASGILHKDTELNQAEQLVTDCVIKMMDAEDELEYEEPYLNGLHYMLNQPEFAQSNRLQKLVELVEQRSLLKRIIPADSAEQGVQVIIGRENKDEAIHDYSVVFSQYGIPNEAIGNIGVVGPTRMPYGRVISTVDYLSSVLSRLVADLYGKKAKESTGDTPV